MSTKNILSWLLLLFGGAIMITAFILFRGETPANILVMNMVVGLFMYGLLSFNYGAPWIDLKDRSQKQIGALGINWFVAWFYTILAMTTMIVSNIALEFSFSLQLIIHCGLLFFLGLGVWFANHTADKVKEVYEIETQNRSGINEMKTAMRNLKDKMNDLNDLPEQFKQRINRLEENLRFISPSNNSEVYNLENSFVETLNDIKAAISDYAMNEERIESNLKKSERLYQNRKSIYSK